MFPLNARILMLRKMTDVFAGCESLKLVEKSHLKSEDQ